jgi:membrane-associated phospholipid phosphatase
MNPFRDARELLRAAVGLVRERCCLFSLIPLVAVVLVAAAHRGDEAWSRELLGSRAEELRWLARRFGGCGDFQTGTMAVVVALWLVGWWRGSRRLRIAAMACLLSASVAGTAATFTRTMTGRPRPSAELPDGFYGPRIDHRFQSFASAHAATSMGTSVALAVSVPAVGLPLAALSLGVPWSRFYMREHYVSDVIAGGAMGLWFGLVFGLAARRKFQSLEDPVWNVPTIGNQGRT